MFSQHRAKQPHQCACQQSAIYFAWWPVAHGRNPVSYANRDGFDGTRLRSSVIERLEDRAVSCCRSTAGDSDIVNGAGQCFGQFPPSISLSASPG
jgi:hypothetical protein